MGRWFFGCPAYQSGPGKDGFRHLFLDLFLLLVRVTIGHFTTAKTYVGTYIHVRIGD